MKRILFFALALGLGGTALAQQPEELIGGDPNISIEYYEIAAADARLISKQIEERGPGEVIKGKPAAAVTQLKYSYGWPGYSDGTCDLSKAKVDYKIVVVMPKLADGMKLRGETGQWWLRMIAALTRHELDHVRIALGYMAEMEKTLKASTCDAASADAERVHAAYRTAQTRYDQITQHGTWTPSRKY